MINLTIYGEPVPKGRPKFSNNRVYTPKKTLDWEIYIKQCWNAKYGKSEPITEGVQIRLVFYMHIPKSTSKAKRQSMLERETEHLKKPDLDNLVKTVLDALNGLAYKDDSQIYDIAAFKCYSENPRTEIEIREGNNG